MNPRGFGGGPSRWGGERRPPDDDASLVGRLLTRYPFFEERPFLLALLIVAPVWLVIIWALVYFC